MKLGLAKIQVQQTFCEACVQEIKDKLSKVQGICNVRPFPDESKVVFHFEGAFPLSCALNTLMELGHPPKGDVIKKENYVPPLCHCTDLGNHAA